MSPPSPCAPSHRRASQSLLAFIGVACAVAAACHDQTGPESRRPLARPPVLLANQVTAGAAPLTGTLTPSAVDGSTARITMGTYPTNVLATMTISGDMVVKPTQYGRDSAKLTDTIYDPGGAFDYQWGSCKGSITVQAVDVRDRTFWFSPCNGPGQHTTQHQATGIFRGDVMAQRSSAITSCIISQNPGSKCWDYAGATPVTTVTVTPVKATLSLTATPNAVAPPGDSVVFSLSLTPDSAFGFAVPFALRGTTPVRWMVGGVQQPAPPCQLAGLGRCTGLVTQTGVLFVDATVNGQAVTVSVSVRVIQCPTGDTIVDLKGFRDALTNAETVGPASGPASQRHERGTVGFRMGGDTLRHVVNVSDTADTPCANFGQPPAPVPPFDSIAYTAHTHSGFSLGPPPDTVPRKQCKRPIIPGTVDAYGYGVGGFSEADVTSAFDNHLPIYVLDADSIYRLSPFDTSDIVGWRPYHRPNGSLDSVIIGLKNMQRLHWSKPRKLNGCTVL